MEKANGNKSDIKCNNIINIEFFYQRINFLKTALLSYSWYAFGSAWNGRAALRFLQLCRRLGCWSQDSMTDGVADSVTG